jgi:CelD/BcsL family acetyltransferase involved in cellulose biosynthesis
MSNTASPVQVDLIDRWPPPDDVLEAWRALAVERENVFITPEWYGTWLALHPGDQPLTFLCHDQSEGLVGVLPLVMTRSGPARILRFAAARFGDFFGPACRPADEPAVASACAAALASLSPGWHVLKLDRLERDRAWAEQLTAAWPGGDVVIARWRQGDVLPYIEIGADGFDGYLAGRSRHFRKQLGSERRRLERRHSVQFRLTQDERHLERDLSVLFGLHHASWASRGGSSLRGNGELFHREFARLALAREWLRLWTLELDGAPAAAWYGWRVGTRYCYSFSGFDPAHSDEGVGRLLVSHTIEQAADEGAAVYDLLWGDEAYKRRFETGRRWADSVLVTRRGQPLSAAVTGLTWAMQSGRRLPEPVRKRVKRALRRAGDGPWARRARGRGLPARGSDDG